jgi:hypothetical protein
VIKPILTRAILLAALLPPTLHADPLHSLANDAYWHHESNFIFPAALAEFTRVGAPQEVDGSTTVIAYYARGAGDSRMVVVIEVVPGADGPSGPPADSSGSTFVRAIARAGWRVTVRAALPDDATRARVEALIRALPVERLGTLDTRCPNAGCGT